MNALRIFKVVKMKHARHVFTQSLLKSKESPDGSKVVLHQHVRGKLAPSISPFPMKVETYLRVNKIPYKCDFSKPLGPKGKTPWITFQNESVPDSQFIFEFLNEKFDIDMNQHLTDSERAVAKSFRHLAEDHLYWTVVYTRWVFEQGQAVLDITGWPNNIKGKLMIALTRRKMMKQCWNQGMGRHTYPQIIELAEQDIHAISSFLGDKPYLMGDKICEEDCSLFSFIAQLIYHPYGAEEETEMLIDQCSNLSDYCDRIKEEFWPDWDELIRKKSSKL